MRNVKDALDVDHRPPPTADQLDQLDQLDFTTGERGLRVFLASCQDYVRHHDSSIFTESEFYDLPKIFVRSRVEEWVSQMRKNRIGFWCLVIHHICLFPNMRTETIPDVRLFQATSLFPTADPSVLSCLFGLTRPVNCSQPSEFGEPGEPGKPGEPREPGES